MKKKALLIFVVIFLLGVIAIILYLNLKERKVIVFAYHKVVPNEIKEKYYKDNPWVDTTERFQEQMAYLYKHGYKTLSMDEYESWRNGKKKIPIKTVMITIDDGDIETYYEMMPILKKYNMKATSFVIGEHIPEIAETYEPYKQQFLGKDLIQKIRKEYPNLEIQSHSFHMHNRNGSTPYVMSMSKEEIETDFKQMEEFKTNVYCYPYGVHNDEILEVLKDRNYRMAFKLSKAELSRKSDNPYLIERVGVNYETNFATFKKWLLKQIIF